VAGWPGGPPIHPAKVGAGAQILPVRDADEGPGALTTWSICKAQTQPRRTWPAGLDFGREKSGAGFAVADMQLQSRWMARDASPAPYFGSCRDFQPSSQSANLTLSVWLR
jgi:hypothetical protein